MFYCSVSQIARVTKRSTFLSGCIFTLACPSQHSRRAGGRVPHTVVWGRVEIDQLLFLFSHQSVSVVVSCAKLVVQEWYSDSSAVYFFQFWSNHGKRGKLLPASFHIATTGDAMTLAYFSEICSNNLLWIGKSDSRPLEIVVKRHYLKLKVVQYKVDTWKVPYIVPFWVLFQLSRTWLVSLEVTHKTLMFVPTPAPIHKQKQ